MNRKLNDPEIIKQLMAMEKRTSLNGVRYTMKLKTILYRIIFIVGLLGFVASLIHFPQSLLLLIPTYLILILNHRWYTRQNAGSYLDNFLLPVFHELFPQAKISYFEGIEPEIWNKVTPGYEDLTANCHISFHDEKNIEFCNLYLYKEERYRTALNEDYGLRDDIRYRNKKVFRGQILTAECPTGLNGHVRIVPSWGRGLLGDEDLNGYKPKTKEESRLDIGNAPFDKAFEVFTTDEVGAKKLLTGRFAELISGWRNRCPVCLYLDQQKIIISFDDNYELFELPDSMANIQNISLVSEYDKLREPLTDMYDLLEIICGQE